MARGKAESPTIRVRVAPRRTVVAPHPTRTRMAEVDGVVKSVPVQAEHLYPTILTLPRAEAEELRRAGFVTDIDEAPLAPEETGPAMRDDAPGRDPR